jgi:chaperone modulatory protein CbpM
MLPLEEALQGTLVDESTLLSIEDLCRICAIEPRLVVEFVEEGVLEVAAIDTDEWRFRGGALRRVRTAVRLQRDLELNLVGIALTLDLMEEIQQLRREIRARR